MLGIYYCIFEHLKKIRIGTFYGLSDESLQRFFYSKGASPIQTYKFRSHISSSSSLQSLQALQALSTLDCDFITAAKSLSEKFDFMGSIFFSCYDLYLQGHSLDECIAVWSGDNTVYGILFAGTHCGQINETLQTVCQYLEEKSQFISEIYASLIYPILSLIFVQAGIVINCYFLELTWLYILPGFCILGFFLITCSLIERYSIFKLYGFFYSLYIMQKAGLSLQDGLLTGNEIFGNNKKYTDFKSLILQGQPFQDAVLCLLDQEAYLYSYRNTITACRNLALFYKGQAQARIKTLKNLCGILPIIFTGICCGLLAYIFVSGYAFQMQEMLICA